MAKKTTKYRTALPAKPDNKVEKNDYATLQNINRDKILDFFVSPVSQWSVDAVCSAIDNHERGNFITSGKMSDNMLRDSRVASVLDTRVLGVLALPFEWKFDNEPSQADKDALATLQIYWNKIFENSVAAQLLKTTLLMGFSISNIYWRSIDNLWIPQITPWHPSNTYYNIGTRLFNIMTETNGVIEYHPGDYKWLLLKHLDHERPYMAGLVRRLGTNWLAKQYALADWRTNSAVYGNPIRKLSTTMEAAAQIDVYQFIRDITDRIRKGAPIALPAGFDLIQMDSSQKSPEMFKLLIDKCDTEIAIAVLGQNLTTDSTQGNGSYALGSVHAKILQTYIEADIAMLQKSIYEQVIVPFYSFNFEDTIQIPKPSWDAVPPEDVGEVSKGMLDRSMSLVHLADALSKLKDMDMIKDINVNDLLREFRLPLATSYTTPNARN